METLSVVLQIIVALGLLNVWLLRANKQTNYRGAKAVNIKEEFQVYGLPPWAWIIVGSLKVLAAIFLIVGAFYPGVRVIPAGLLVILMVGAVLCHFKVGDPIKKSVPAIAMLAMNAAIVLINA